METVHFLLFVFYLVITLLTDVHCKVTEEESDQEILDRINQDGKCYHKDNMLFYPIRNTVLIDADSVVFEFTGAINYTLMCCMFNGTRFVNSSNHKIQKCTQNTPRQIQRLHGVSCCKFSHRITFRSGFYSHVMKDYTSDTSDTWATLTSLTARITREQTKAAVQRGQIDGKMDQVVYEGFFQLHYPKVSTNVDKPIYAPIKPGKSYIRRTWQLVNGLSDVHIAADMTIAIPGSVITCSVSNATTPRVKLYPSLEPNVFKDKCDFHTTRVRSHEPRASKLKNSRATYPHFSLPQVATYVTARSWSTFPKCAFDLGPVSTVSVTVRCRTSVAHSQAQADAWSANSVQMKLYNPSVVMKVKRAYHYFIDEVEFGFMFSKSIPSPYSLQILIPTVSQKAVFQVPKKDTILSFYANARPGIYIIETRVASKKQASSTVLSKDSDLIFRDTLRLTLHPLEPKVDPLAQIHYIFEIVRCRASVDSDKFMPYLGWDIGNLDPEVRSKLVLHENGTAFVFMAAIKHEHQPLTFHCRLGSRLDNVKSVQHTFRVRGKPNLRLKPMRTTYHINDLVTCETDRKSYGEVVLQPLNLCKDEGSWCPRRIEAALRERHKSDTFAFPMYLKEAKYQIQCEIKPFNSTGKLATKRFTISYSGVKMDLYPNQTHFNFLSEISCVPVQFKDHSVYLEFPRQWAKFVKITKPGSFVVSDIPNQGWMTFFCGLSDFERKLGKNFTIFIEDSRFGRLETRNKQRRQGSGSWEFYTYALFVGFLNNLLLLYVAFAINFLIRMHEARRACVRRFIEKYNIAAYEEASPGFFNDLMTFACEENLVQSTPEARHFYSTN